MPHRGLTNLVRWHNEAYGLGPGTVVSQVASPAFDAAVWEIWPALAAGASLAMMPSAVRQAPEAVLPWLARTRTEVCFLPTPLAEAVLASVDGPSQDGSESPTGLGLRHLLTGGDALHRRPAPESPFRLVNHYGPTECSVVATAGPVRPRPDRGRPDFAEPAVGLPSIGRPIDGLTVRIVDAFGRPAPVGAPGELCLGGEAVAHGYAGRPGWTAAAFIPDAFASDVAVSGAETPGGRLYRTGDLARWLPDGRIEYLGRLDHQVQVRGHRVEPDEIAAVLAGHPAVREVAVVAPEAAPGDRRLVAWVVARGDDLDGPELRSWLAERLPRAMVPAAVVAVPELPRTASGKIDRRALLGRGVPAAGLDAGLFVAPRTPVEEVLAGLFEDVLGVERVGAHDGFFDLGGHSLLATRLVSRVRSTLGVELPLRALFETPTVAALAAALEATEGQAAVGAIEPRTEDGPLPLSSSQERLWFLARFEPGNASLHIPGSVRLRGALDAAALASALDLVMARHEALRTTFGEVDGRPVQRVVGTLTVPLPVVDLAELPPAARQASSEQWLERAARAPFDLERGPLLRTLLLRVGADDHLLSLVVHHVVADGWSMDVLVRELAEGYAAARRGEVPELPRLPIQYPDYALWQRRELAAGALSSQLDYWRRQLGGAPALELPTDRPRPAVQTFTGGRVTRVLPPALHGALRALGRRRGVTLFMTLLALLEVLLSRLSGQDDLTVGTPIAGRRHEEVEGLIGLFLNSLALRTDLGGDPSFADLLDRVRTTALEAYAHQDVPFERILEEVLPERDLSRTPLFQVFFNMLNLPTAAIELPGVTLEPHRVPQAHAKFDLTIYAREDDDGISLDLVYNADLFDRPRMEELLGQLEHVARQAAETPERPIGALSLVTTEARALLPAPETRLGDAWEGALHDLVARHAAATPDRTAVTDPESSWSYAYLDSASARLAAALQAQGVTRGDRVVIFGHRSAGLVVSLLAILRSGGAFVVLDPAQPAPRLARTVELAAPRAFLALEAAGPVPAELDAALGQSCPRGLRSALAGAHPARRPGRAPALAGGVPGGRAPGLSVEVGPDGPGRCRLRRLHLRLHRRAQGHPRAPRLPDPLRAVAAPRLRPRRR